MYQTHYKTEQLTFIVQVYINLQILNCFHLL